MLKIIGLANVKEKGVNILTATFLIEGGLIPLRINEKDNRDDYHKALSMLSNGELNTDQGAEYLYKMMSPVDRVKSEISRSKKLQGNLSVLDGQIYFGKYQLEETLASHMLSLLGDNNTPKDEKLWGSYVKFLDNLHQNMDEDIRKQLYKWLAYENESLGGFGITEDGCLIGYRGCNGTVLEPVSVHSGPATVDGIDMDGHIPNKVGSVITMPRSAVQVDPAIGCSTGLHVGTKDYATGWAPILLVVKVNPRDVVSVPYECSNQKMRVCKYEVLEVLDTGGEQNHTMYRPAPAPAPTPVVELEFEFPYQDNLEAYLDTYVSIAYDGDNYFEGYVVNVWTSGDLGLVVKSEDGEYKHIKLHRISTIDCDDLDLYWSKSDNSDSLDNEQDELISLLEVFDLIEKEIKVDYLKDGTPRTFQGVVVEVYDSEVKPGIVIKSSEGDYKHIKLSMITSLGVITSISDTGVEEEEVLTQKEMLEAMIASIREKQELELAKMMEEKAKVDAEEQTETKAVKIAKEAKVGDYIIIKHGKSDELIHGTVVKIVNDYEGLMISVGPDIIKYVKLDNINEAQLLF